MFARTAEEAGDGQRKGVKISRKSLEAESDFQPGFDIPRASTSNEKKTPGECRTRIFGRDRD